MEGDYSDSKQQITDREIALVEQTILYDLAINLGNSKFPTPSASPFEIDRLLVKYEVIKR